MAEPWTSGAGPQDSDQPFRPFDRRALEDTLADALRDVGADGPAAEGRTFGTAGPAQPDAFPERLPRSPSSGPVSPPSGSLGDLPLRRPPGSDPHSPPTAGGALPGPAPRPSEPSPAARPAPMTAPSSAARPAPRPSLLGSGLIGAPGTGALGGGPGIAAGAPARRGAGDPPSGPLGGAAGPAALRPPEPATVTPLRPPSQLQGLSRPGDLGGARLGSGLSTSGYAPSPASPAAGEQPTIPLRRPKRADPGADIGARPAPASAEPPAAPAGKAPAKGPAPTPIAATGPAAQTGAPRPTVIVTGWSPADDDILPQSAAKRRSRRR